MAELRWGAATDRGQIRTGNEDQMFAGESLFVVADGMGGHQAGEVASKIAVDRLRAGLDDETPRLADLVTAINEANRDILRAAVSNPDQHGMGTTITSLAVMEDPVDGEVFALANVGDSRTYLFRHGRLRQLTVDHNYVQELVAEGHITRDEARNHPRRNIVTRALGIEPDVRVDSWLVAIVRGDRFVLCSDGLNDEVHDDEIAEVLAAHDDPQEAADELVRRANGNGGRDNITVIVVDVVEGLDPPDPTAEIDVVPVWAPPEGEPADGADASASLSESTDGDGDGDGGDANASAEPESLPEITSMAELYDGAADLDPVEAETARDDTDADDLVTADETPVPQRKRSRLLQFAFAVGVAAVLVAAFTILAAWARSGYFVAFDDDRHGRDLPRPTRRRAVVRSDGGSADTRSFTRDELDDRSVELVDGVPRFETRRSAEEFVAT
jgi:PPM family protein phosphatase